MVRPGGMSDAHWNRIQRMTELRRDLTLERAAIIHEACDCSWDEADERAIAEEAPQRSLAW